MGYGRVSFWPPLELGEDLDAGDPMKNLKPDTHTVRNRKSPMLFFSVVLRQRDEAWFDRGYGYHFLAKTVLTDHDGAPPLRNYQISNIAGISFAFITIFDKYLLKTGRFLCGNFVFLGCKQIPV